MNTWIIVLSAIGGIVVGWVASKWWWGSCYQPVVDQLYKQNVEMQQQLEILENIQHLKSIDLSQMTANQKDTETDYRDKGYQEWVEEHRTDDQLLNEIYGNGQKMQESYDPTYKRPPEVSTDHYLNIKGDLS